METPWEAHAPPELPWHAGKAGPRSHPATANLTVHQQLQDATKASGYLGPQCKDPNAPHGVWQRLPAKGDWSLMVGTKLLN